MPRYCLRTLLIVLALGPPVLVFVLVCSLLGCTQKKNVSVNSIDIEAV